MIRRSVAIMLLLLVVVCFTLASCGVNVISHDPQNAAALAEQFAEAAFIKKDFASAYSDLAPQMQRAVSVETLTAEVTKMHQTLFPTEVTATEFEPLPRQKAMNIYLKGSGGEEEFFYRFLMIGTKGSGYKVGGLWRGSGPYPPSARSPL